MISSQSIKDDEWLSYLRRNDIIDNQTDMDRRKKICNILNTALRVFEESVSRKIMYMKGTIDCILMPFGSYGLAAHLKNADIDMVLISPKPVTRALFFELLPGILRDHKARDIECVKRANVPIIKCTVNSIPVDISFVQIKEKESIEKDIDLLENRLLKSMDQYCVASMDGPRVQQFIRKQVDRKHIKVFQTSLRYIKYWATQRGLYSKPIGYLNGGAWTILLVRVYLNEKNQPDMSVSSLLYHFFKTWAEWSWDKPVKLTNIIPDINDRPCPYDSIIDFNNAIMPIVSPCYPVSNAAPYVTKSTLKVLTREFLRGYQILSANKQPEQIVVKLFKKVNYLAKYNTFICVMTSAKTSNSNDIWTRKMATYIPQFIQIIQNKQYINLIQPLSNPIKKTYSYRNEEELQMLHCGLSMEEARQQCLSSGVFPGVAYITYYMMGIALDKIDHKESLDISDDVTTFIQLLNSKRNRNDGDVHWSIHSLNKRQAAAVMDIPIEGND